MSEWRSNFSPPDNEALLINTIPLPIRQAALGYISGTLAEWPFLDGELKKLGIDLPKSTSSDTCRKECLRILNQHR